MDELIREEKMGAGANRVLAITRKMYNWGIGRDRIEMPANPCSLVRPPAPETRRDRFLDEDEIKAFWTALDAKEARISPNMAAVVRFQNIPSSRMAIRKRKNRGLYRST